ncbi:hypothetical protein ACRALDRAFT_1078007 [Sodiomyces alcalophilus JCM 7366]|uniref:uncharacterized protein n=1 Tax=Sodiomyces alcalophilus JCM 7366 TaxID=591952 RepID=UPI0039B61136
MIGGGWLTDRMRIIKKITLCTCSSSPVLFYESHNPLCSRAHGDCGRPFLRGHAHGHIGGRSSRAFSFYNVYGTMLPAVGHATLMGVRGREAPLCLPLNNEMSFYEYWASPAIDRLRPGLHT